MGLTTKELYATYRGEATATDATEVAQINAIIDGVSAAIENYCDRTFAATEYAEWVDGSGDEVLLLEYYPISRIYLTATTSVNVGHITYGGASLYASAAIIAPSVALPTAGASYTEGEIRTIHFDATGARVSTTVQFGAGGTELMMSDLKTAFDTALSAAGWTFTIESGYESAPAGLLRPISQSFVDASTYMYLEHPDVGISTNLSDRSERGVFISSGGGFPAGHRNVFIDYAAGYELPVTTSLGTTPANLVMAANLIVSDFINQYATDGSLKSERIGDYAYTLNEASFSSAVRARSEMLAPYKRISI